MTTPSHDHAPAPQALSTGHVGLNVSDLERSIRFYQEILGLEVMGHSAARGREYAFLGSQGRLLLTLWQQAAGRFSPDLAGLHHLAFQVESIDEVKRVQRLVQQAGAAFVHRGIVPHAEGTPDGGIYFEDPDGARIEVYSPTGAEDFPAPTPDGPSCGFF